MPPTVAYCWFSVSSTGTARSSPLPHDILAEPRDQSPCSTPSPNVGVAEAQRLENALSGDDAIVGVIGGILRVPLGRALESAVRPTSRRPPPCSAPASPSWLVHDQRSIPLVSLPVAALEGRSWREGIASVSFRAGSDRAGWVGAPGHQGRDKGARHPPPFRSPIEIDMRAVSRLDVSGSTSSERALILMAEARSRPSVPTGGR